MPAHGTPDEVGTQQAPGREEDGRQQAPRHASGRSERRAPRVPSMGELLAAGEAANAVCTPPDERRNAA